ncbi:hypothetical protein D3C78_1784800 [compost metagenome]
MWLKVALGYKLRLNPVDKCPHVRSAQVLLASNHVVGKARRPWPVYRYHQSAASQVFFRVLRLYKRDALATGSRA